MYSKRQHKKETIKHNKKNRIKRSTMCNMSENYNQDFNIIAVYERQSNTKSDSLSVREKNTFYQAI